MGMGFFLFVWRRWRFSKNSFLHLSIEYSAGNHSVV